MRYVPTIGLEIHAELMTKTKLFCSCKNSFGGKENSRICPVCTGMPGSLPVLNKAAVQLAVKAGLIFGCRINRLSAFDRKNYFYPDLPKAYQITQFSHPICTNGRLSLKSRTIRIKQVHIEEDAGKLIHDAKNGIAHIDLNRCGVPLIEIVTEPDMHSSSEVKEFVKQVLLNLKYADVCSGRMEQGALRVDVNISVAPENSASLGQRTEIKNLNSLRSVERAIEFECSRQSAILENGGMVAMETRGFDERSGRTYPMRSKEKAHDYRYFPEPDIPPVILSEEDIAAVRISLPELPQERAARYKQYGLSPEEVSVILSERGLSDFYDSSVSIFPAYKLSASLLTGEVNRSVNETGINIADSKLTPAAFAETVKMTTEGTVSLASAKALLSELFTTEKDPQILAQERGYILKSDPAALNAVVSSIIDSYPDCVSEYKNGNEKIFGFLMGKAVRAAGKSFDPKAVRNMLLKRLKEL